MRWISQMGRYGCWVAAPENAHLVTECPDCRSQCDSPVWDTDRCCMRMAGGLHPRDRWSCPPWRPAGGLIAGGNAATQSWTVLDVICRQILACRYHNRERGLGPGNNLPIELTELESEAPAPLGEQQGVMVTLSRGAAIAPRSTYACSLAQRWPAILETISYQSRFVMAADGSRRPKSLGVACGEEHMGCLCRLVQSRGGPGVVPLVAALGSSCGAIIRAKRPRRRAR